MTTILDLPDDILYSIFPYLTAAEFLRLTGSTKSLLPLREDASFWHTLTRKTFRIPPQPLLQGARWQWLYKKLLTQTRLYTWGSNGNQNLGRHTTYLGADGNLRNARGSGWPREPQLDFLDVGIVADVQCGGWSTTLLNSTGNIFIFGIIDGMGWRDRGESRQRQLTFPPAYPPTTKDRYEPSTAIKQFSTGRATVLGLSDDGKVWSWTQDTAALIKPLHVDLRDHEVKTVVAGWDRSSMYVQDIGIVYWAPVRDSDLIQGGRQENLAMADALLIDTVTIPGTGYRTKSNARVEDNSLEARIGEVTNHIVLESHIVFTTHLNKIFSYPTTYPMPPSDMPEPLEITTFQDILPPTQPLKILDLQGAFRRFAIFSASNTILTADRDFLDDFRTIKSNSESQTALPIPTLLLQPSHVARIISLAFGDHHTHALHEDGIITSWGQQSRWGGALGLGDNGREEIRGINGANHWGDQRLAQNRAKTVWFEPLMETWLADVYQCAKETAVPERVDLSSWLEARADYFEKEGAKWECDVTARDELGAYFVLKVAAAGWHSAALVLVDEGKAERARDVHTVDRYTPSEVGSVDYEHIDSPFDKVEMALYEIFSWLWWAGRWFLGLTMRDERREAENQRKRAHARVNGHRSEAQMREDDLIYTWRENPLPAEEILAMKEREPIGALL